ncbi:hypothetical protein FRC06_010359, partial [Ceratobasidium sp. 370]
MVHIEVPVPEPRGRTTTRAQPQPVTQPRGRGRTARNLERSPTPGSTDIEDLPIVSGNTPAGSQYTYVYETVDHATLVRIAEKKVAGGANLTTWSTKDLLAAIQGFGSDQTTSVAAERRPTSIQFIPGPSIAVGGGQVRGKALVAPEAPPANSQPSKLQPSKRKSDASDGPAVKRVCSNPDMATEDESEDDATTRQTAAATAARILSAQARATPHPRPNLQPASKPAPGTQPPLPSHQPTATTVPATQPSRQPTTATLLETEPDAQPSGSRNGESQRPLPPLPNIFSPVQGPVHARLRAKAIERAFPPELFAHQVDEDSDEDEADKLETSNPSQQEHVRHSGHTYGCNRTHLASALDMLADMTEAAIPPPRPNSPSLDPVEMLRRERVRAILDKARAEVESRSRIRPHRHAAQPSQPPTRRPTAPAPTQGSSNAGTSTSRRQQQGRLDPVSAARSDMLAFNREVQEQNVESFIESVTRRHRRKGPCGLVEPCELTGLLADDEELLAQAEALAKSTTPKPTRRRRRNRKKKPLARDTIGVARQVLVLAKIHLFAFALVEGIYQTRSTFLQWAALIHEETWRMELPDVEYIAATMSELEV